MLNRQEKGNVRGREKILRKKKYLKKKKEKLLYSSTLTRYFIEIVKKTWKCHELCMVTTRVYICRYSTTKGKNQRAKDGDDDVKKNTQDEKKRK